MLQCQHLSLTEIKQSVVSSSLCFKHKHVFWMNRWTLAQAMDDPLAWGNLLLLVTWHYWYIDILLVSIQQYHYHCVLTSFCHKILHPWRIGSQFFQVFLKKLKQNSQVSISTLKEAFVCCSHSSCSQVMPYKIHSPCKMWYKNYLKRQQSESKFLTIV